MKYNYLLWISILIFLFAWLASSFAHAGMIGDTSAEAYVNGDVNVNNQGNARIAVGSAIGNIGSGVHTSTVIGGLDIENSGDLQLSIGSVVSDGPGSISNVSTSAHVGNLRITNGGQLRMAIGSIAP